MFVESHHRHANQPSPRSTLRLVRKENQAEFAQLLSCLAAPDIEIARQAEVLVLSGARLSFDGNGQPNLNGFREAGAAAGRLVAESATLGLRVHAMVVWNVTSARQAAGMTDDYEPVTIVAVSRNNIAQPETGEKLRFRGGLSGYKLRRVTRYLEAHLHEQIRLADVAAAVDMSPYHLCRIFLQSTGLATPIGVERGRCSA